ncbi:MAG TPA: EF-hand domain-containing protein [Gemmataceae bacterium]|nr:EF-hand domain-containing protein [Gemmataceae bacterium]
MPRSIPAAVMMLILLAGSVYADDKAKNDSSRANPVEVTITKVDPKSGAVTVKYTDDKGSTHERTFRLTGDVRLLDETGRVVAIDVFESGDEAMVVESEGKLRELRRTPHAGRTRHLSDSVRTLIEMADCDEGCTEDLQKIYDMLRKLDTGKNGKIDAQAVKAEADRFLQDRVREVFQRLDSNRDGKLSKTEARGLIKEHFDKIDTNKDGFITFDELLKAAKERREQKAAGSPTSTNQATPKEKH